MKNKGISTPLVALIIVATVILIGGGITYYYTTPKAQPIACTEDAKICPDGSVVGRTGPNCEFAACPDETANWATYSYEDITFKYPSEWLLNTDQQEIEPYHHYSNYISAPGGLSVDEILFDLDMPYAGVYRSEDIYEIRKINDVFFSISKEASQNTKEIFDLIIESAIVNWKTYRNNDFNFEFKYPNEFFLREPVSFTFDCEKTNFPTECPNINDELVKRGIESKENLESTGYPRYWKEPEGEKVTINNDVYCLFSHNEGAAGSSYLTSYYTTVKNKKCFVLSLIDRFINCGVYEPQDPSYENCKNENEVTKPNILTQILSTFKFTK